MDHTEVSSFHKNVKKEIQIFSVNMGNGQYLIEICMKAKEDSIRKRGSIYNCRDNIDRIALFQSIQTAHIHYTFSRSLQDYIA